MSRYTYLSDELDRLKQELEDVNNIVDAYNFMGEYSRVPHQYFSNFRPDFHEYLAEGIEPYVYFNNPERILKELKVADGVFLFMEDMRNNIETEHQLPRRDDKNYVAYYRAFCKLGLKPSKFDHRYMAECIDKNLDSYGEHCRGVDMIIDRKNGFLLDRGEDVDSWAPERDEMLQSKDAVRLSVLDRVYTSRYEFGMPEGFLSLGNRLELESMGYDDYVNAKEGPRGSWFKNPEDFEEVKRVRKKFLIPDFIDNFEDSFSNPEY